MKKYYFMTAILFFWLLSCSNEESKTQNQVATRPTVPPTVSEVQIGTQIWTTRNLNVSRYRNGDPIPQVTDPTQWANLTTGAWCYFNNDLEKGRVYGKLYNWYAVNDSRGLAPTGWHVPSDAEWNDLSDFLGGPDVGWTAGNKMKAITGWRPYSGITNTNSSGFTGLPGGCRNPDGAFNGVGDKGYWWNSSVNSTTYAWYRSLYYNSSIVLRDVERKSYGFSGRCIRD